MTDVRRIVYDALLLSDEGKASINLSKDVLNKYSYLDGADRSFIKRLIEGVVERRITLDHVIGQYSKTPVSKMKKQIRTILRMGTYQILYMDKVADHAAVNESVSLARKIGFSNLSGFVNGVLRTIARNRDNISWPDEKEDNIHYLSVRYSCPEWIVKKLIDENGEENAITLLSLSVSIRPVSARVNLSRSSVKAVTDCGVATPSEVLENAVILHDYDNITGLDAVRSGSICIQDISSMLVCTIAGIKAGDTVLDLCAAPGGKSLHAADIATEGRVISCDVSENKLMRIKENVQRCGFSNTQIILNDASEYNEEFSEIADVCIADVPCSGLGIMGRKNDIKYNLTPEGIASLSKLQKQILSNAIRYVKKGGTLMFSTCTCTKEENMGNYEFLKNECGLEPIDFYDVLPQKLKEDTAMQGYIQLYGKDGITDGFFIARFMK